jgi:hypothetical protein
MVMYVVLPPPGIQIPPDRELEFDNLREARLCSEELSREFGSLGFKVSRDGRLLSEDELDAETKGDEIRAVMEQDAKLPATYRRGRTGDSDIGSGADGGRHGVWRPRNPEDEYN